MNCIFIYLMTTANYNISIQYNKVELNLRFLFQLRTRATLTRLIKYGFRDQFLQ